MAWVSGLKENKNLSNNLFRILKKIGSSVDGWSLKDLVFNILSYKFLSLRFEEFIKSTLENFEDYKNKTEKWDKELKQEVLKSLGYAIEFPDLFNNVSDLINKKDSLDYLKNVFERINNSSESTSYGDRIKGLFSLNICNSERVNYDSAVRVVFEHSKNIEFDYQNDSLGDLYTYLCVLCFNRGSREGGEYFTPSDVSKLLSLLTLKAWQREEPIETVYDPACGSGSLLLNLEKQLEDSSLQMYGQEINPTTWSLARINMLINKKHPKDFNIEIGDTLENDRFESPEIFDCVVSNPPFSIVWESKKNKKNLEDKRFEGGVAPSSCADWGFIQTGLYHLKKSGVMVCICYPSILIRKTEEKIREWILKENYLDAVIHLPERLFYTTTNDVVILVFKKIREKNQPIRFIEASTEFEKAPRKCKLNEENLKRIVEWYTSEASQDPERLKFETPEELLKNSSKFWPKNFKINSHAIHRMAWEKYKESEKTGEWRWIS